MILSLGACTDANQAVDEKLAAIVGQQILLDDTPKMDIVTTPLVYQVGKNPFANPHRMSNANPSSQPNQAIMSDGITSHTNQISGKPDTGTTKIVQNGKQIQSDNASEGLSRTDLVRQPLQQYEIEQLSYHGSIWDNQTIVALIVAPDGFIYQASIGQPIGRNQGKITQIDAQKIYITERFLAADGHYYHHKKTLNFIR